MDTPTHSPTATAFFYISGAVAFVIATIVFVAVAVVISFGISYCGSPTPSSEVWRARGGLLIAGLIWSATPAAWGLLARRTHRPSTAWTVFAALCATLIVLGAMTLEPTMWCF